MLSQRSKISFGFLQLPEVEQLEHVGGLASKEERNPRNAQTDSHCVCSEADMGFDLRQASRSSPVLGYGFWNATKLGGGGQQESPPALASGWAFVHFKPSRCGTALQLSTVDDLNLHYP